MADEGALELVPAASGRLAGDGLLQVSVQALVRVELGAVGRQVEDLDLLLALPQPALHRAGPMDGQVVQDQEHLAVGILDEPPEKADQARRRDGAIEHHPAQLALVGES